MSVEHRLHPTEGSGVQETPQDFFDELDQEFHFTLDVCALPENAKCKKYFTPEIDGLSQSWQGERCWMNPPYGRKQVYPWVKKAYWESRVDDKCIVVALLRSTTEVRWWHDFVWDKTVYRCRDGVRIRFPKGRLKFGNYDKPAEWGSVIVIFGGGLK